VKFADFFAAHKERREHMLVVFNLEMTGQHVTECTGGAYQQAMMIWLSR